MRFAIVPAIAILLSAQTPPKPDNCAPPPGSVPPPLPAKLLSGQGTIHFPITTSSKQAQAFFNQGVAQLHSFWFREAERSFLQAARLDPKAPMPHWGIAMSAPGDFRPGFQNSLLNGAEARKRKTPHKPSPAEARAVAAVSKALELAAVSGAATETEKLYLAAVSARRNVQSSTPEADYTAALRTLVTRYPKEVEARTYLALQIMSGFVLPLKTPRAGSIEAASMLRQLMKETDEHPGVHHYVIHGFEGSNFAKDAWHSCQRYGALANNIPHGLHMPGHIYAQTGRWNDAVNSFSSAASNEIYWLDQDSLASNGHHGHNVHFLATSHSFAGDFEKALAAGQSLFVYKETPREAKQADNYRTAYRQGWFAVLRTLVQHQKWDLLLDGRTLPEYKRPREQAWRHWALAQAYAAKGDMDAAKRESNLMNAEMALYKSELKAKVPDILTTARLELDGHLAWASGKLDKGLDLLQKAASKERSLRYNEPPLYPRPINEVLGSKAMKAGKLEVAERAFREALDQYPGSSIARTALAKLQPSLVGSN
jgi:tetratricopeptide (TPR) repeat protein